MSEISEIVERLEPGAEVELKLADGTSIGGVVVDVSGGTVQLAEARGDAADSSDQSAGISVDDVTDVIEIITSDGPE